jgi:outer membrane receptor protein involved in Fe transport
MYGFLNDLGPMKLSGDVRTGNVAVGITHVSESGWNAKSEVGYAYETQHTQVDNIVNPTALAVALADPTPAAFNPFGDGSHTSADTLSKIRSQSRVALNSTYRFGRVLADGPLLPMPGGDLKLVAGSEWYGQEFAELSISPDQHANDRLSRNVWAAFGELRLPIVGVTNRIKGIESLDLSAAERIERYSDIGAVSTPSFTAAWSPTAELRFRATEASVFKAPNLGDLSTANAGSELTSLPDPQSTTGQSVALVTFGGNPNLRPETGRSWSVGLDWTPRSIPSLTLSLTRFDIDLEHRVNSLTLDDNVLGGAPRYASFVNRDPTPEQRALACNRGTFYGGDLNSCLTAQGPIVHGEWLNLSRTRTNGYDLTAKYALTTEVGQFDFGLDGTRTIRFAQSFTAAEPMTNLVNTDHNPPALRARASFNYRLGRFGASFWVNYTGPYRDIDSNPQRSVSAWTTLDTQVSYDFQSLSDSVFKDLHLIFSVQNALGSRPPFLNNQLGLGWDQENATPFGRQISFTARKRF